MKNLSEKIREIDAYIAKTGIRTVSFDIDGTIYPLSLVKRRWWKEFCRRPRESLRFLRIRKAWEMLREGRGDDSATQDDVLFFERYLSSLLDPTFVPLAIRDWFVRLQNQGTQIYFMSDHGAEKKLEKLEIGRGQAFNCLGSTGKLKPHSEIAKAFIENFKITAATHLHIGDRWTDEEQARLMNAHFFYLIL